jgi:hypothetical protein
MKNDTFHKHPSVNGIILRQLKAKIQIYNIYDIVSVVKCTTKSRKSEYTGAGS